MIAANRRVLLASLVGTSVEFYDFYIYATAAALVFGPLFFPATSPAMQLLASYASLGVAVFEPGSPFRQVAQLLKAADLAVYNAKHSGRNCVRVAKPPVEPELPALVVREPVPRSR